VNRFEIVAPASLNAAARLLARDGHVAIAGGVDLLDLLKLDLVAPQTLVNLKGLRELEGIEVKSGGELRLGALARLDDVRAHPLIRANFTAIAEAAAETATPQIRNQGTVGGNLLQRPRCWYFRNPEVSCLKKGGDRCYAIGGLNRYHAILGGGPSYIVHPSNLATALVAFDASARIIGPAGERTVKLENFFTLPSVDPRRENALGAGEIIVEVTIPLPPAGAHSTYLEAREKQSFDWPLVSAAAMIVAPTASARVREARIVMGAVAPIPWRATTAEAVLRGATLDAPRAKAAAEAALKGAVPMSDNAYKISMAKAIVRRAILRAGRIAQG
jgi:xanthine dehydrogenase YagS FAD-binding subunit